MSDQPSTPKTIFLNALEIPSAEARRAYIVAQCGDDESLSAEVETFLRHHQELGSFLEPAPADRAATVDTSCLTESAGTVIGPYKLLEQIGEGGMGVVFMAEQQEPVRRRVALKLIKPGMDTRQIIARFEAERQALAVMDHPSIARVLDAGATESGRPYFVMELVRGVPITTFCDQNNLPVRERLELFASVCQAIQHAHTKGIVHRDIKPTNVLVTRQDGKPVVKVIDFGVAKAMGQQLTEKTLFTNFAQMVGTPLYMSPEQAEQSGVDIDTRSDIYSLGVLLYELLTGSTPVNEEQMRKAAFDEVRRIIREDEPQTPSARISGSHTLPAIAAHRHIEPARLTRLVRGELDWIVMKALEKDRSRRYETANAFAADLLHYLHDEPVQACPPSAIYRFGKFARRNRVAITTATLVAAALVLGTIASTWQAIRAETARAAEAEQRQVAEAERAEAERQRAKAEANFQQARKAVDEYFTLVSESTLLDVPGLQPLRKQLLDAALRFYEKAALERTNDPAVLSDVAVTFLRVAQIDILMGRNDDAVAAMRSALDAVDRLRLDYPGAREHYRRLAGYWKGYRPAQLRSEMPKDPKRALETLQRAIETWQELADENPAQPAFRSDLASLCYLTGALLASVNVRESLRHYERSKGILEKLVVDQPDVPEYRADLARVHAEMGGKLARAGRLTESEAAQSRSLSLREELVAAFPNSAQYRVELARTLSERARVAVKQQPAEAEKMFRRAVDLGLSLVLEFPEATIYGDVLAANLSDWGKAAHSSGEKDQIERFNSEATKLVQKVIETLETQIRDRPKDQRAREQLASFCYQVAHRLSLQGILKDLAAPLHRRAIALVEALVVEFPDQHKYRTNWVNVAISWVMNSPWHSNDSESKEIVQKLIETLESQLAAQPKDLTARKGVAFFCHRLAERLYYHEHEDAAAERLQRRALTLFIELADEFPAETGYLEHVGWSYRNLGEIARRAGRLDEAREDYEKAANPFAMLAADKDIPPRNGWYLACHVDMLILLTQILNAGGHPQEALVAAQKNADASEALTRDFPDNQGGRLRMLRARNVLAESLAKVGQDDAAIDSYQKLIADFPEYEDLWRIYDGLAQALAARNRPREADEARRKMVELAPNNAGTLNNLAWGFATAADSNARNASLAVELAKKGVELDPKNVRLPNTLGVAHYRAGNWQDAIEWLKKSIELRTGGDSFDWFFLAMAYWQLDNKDEARKWQAQAVEWMDANKPHDQQLVRFRTEAADLINKESPVTDQESGAKAEGKTAP